MNPTHRGTTLTTGRQGWLTGLLIDVYEKRKKNKRTKLCKILESFLKVLQFSRATCNTNAGHFCSDQYGLQYVSNPKNWSKLCGMESWSVVDSKARCKDMLHVEIKLLKLQEVNHAVHVDPGKSTCRASCKNYAYQMTLNYCLLALHPAGTKLEQQVYSQKQEVLDPNAMPIFFSRSK